VGSCTISTFDRFGPEEKFVKKLFATAIVGLLCSGLGWAQQQPDQSAGSKIHVGTVKGCLEGSRGNYLLTQDGSGMVFRLVGDSDLLKNQLGHEVMVTGQLPGSGPVPSAVGEEESTPTETGSAGSSTTANVIQVSKVQTVSRACTAVEQPTSRY